MRIKIEQQECWTCHNSRDDLAISDLYPHSSFDGAEIYSRQYLYANLLLIISSNKLQIEPAIIKSEMEELARMVAVQNANSKPPDVRDMVRNKGIRKQSLALFCIW